MKKLLFVICSLIGICAQAQQLNYAEYFFDTDPGIGAGIQISFTPADSVNITTGLIISNLTPGFHTLYFRTRNTAGTWSLYQGRKFYLGEQPPVIQDKIVKAELFFDEDNGFTQGTMLNTTAADSVNISANVSTAGLTPGFHRLYARVRDSSGRWSLYKGGEFFIDGTPPLIPGKIVSAEYFYDADPGYGNGTFINTGPVADSVQISTGFSVAALNPGFHNVYVRAKDSNGMWSNYHMGSLFKETSVPTVSPKIVSAEYFINTDPGMGNATAVPSFISGDSIDINCLVSTIGLPEGDDTLYVRVKDSLGVWSFPQMYKFTIDEPAGVAELNSSDLDAIIAPNPTADVATLYMKAIHGGTTTVAVMSSVGVKVWEMRLEFTGQKQIALETANLPAGVYAVEIKNGDMRIIRQLVKL